MATVGVPEASASPLRILSLDGGGIRGISSLLILEDIMEKIRYAKGLDHTPKPCEHFDLIGGTSTGGIIAIMLGRLGMTVDQCIRAYRAVAQQAFIPKRTSILPAAPTGAFSAKALEAAIKQTIREFCVEPECVTQRSQGESTSETCPHIEVAFRHTMCTKTVVLAITKDNVDAPPTLFTTYDTSAGLHGCTIWQVARATSAATTFFKSIKVGRDGIEFIDAGFGYNNPCEVLIEEARRQFPDRTSMRILSIGTGIGDVVTIQNTRRSILSALKKMATSSKKVAVRLDGQYGDSGQYARFNVTQGLEDITLSDWEMASKISAHTINYLKENQRAILKFVDEFIAVAETRERYLSETAHPESVAELDRRVANSPGTAPEDSLGEAAGNAACLPCYHIPLSKNKRFTGRDSALNDLQQKFFIQKECQAVAIVGLGGVGKTQLALQLAYWVKEKKPEYSIFWVPALSEASFEQAYAEIARKLGIRKRNNDEDLKVLVRQYLSSTNAGPWILVVDNADDMRMLFGGTRGGLSNYLPESEIGLTLFTTRSRAVAVAAVMSDVVELGEMTPQEAASYLEKSLSKKELVHNSTKATELLAKLAYLPLAITQAAAYLNTNQVPIAEYLGLLQGTEPDMVSLLSKEFQDGTRYKGSHNAVATTWLVSFNQIRKSNSLAADMLSFISNIEPKAIPQSILPSTGSEVQIMDAIGTLCGYAFLVRRGEDRMFDMHSLVHVATRIWIEKHGVVEETENNAIRHLSKNFPPPDKAHRERWRMYLPHALKVLLRSEDYLTEEKCDLFHLVGLCLTLDRRFKEALWSFGKAYRWTKTLAEEDHNRLVSEHELARAYINDRQIKEAIKILERVVAVQKKILAEEDHDRLASEHELAAAYLHDRQIKEAIKILEHVVAVRKKILAEEDHDRLASEHELAGAYLNDRQIKEAIKILERVVAVQKKTLAEEDHNRLASEHELARAYSNDRQIKEAIKILEHVVVVRKKILAEEDYDRLASEHELARAYINDRQTKEAIKILEHVVAVQKKTLAEEDHFRLRRLLRS